MIVQGLMVQKNGLDCYPQKIWTSLCEGLKKETSQNVTAPNIFPPWDPTLAAPQKILPIYSVTATEKMSFLGAGAIFLCYPQCSELKMDGNTANFTFLRQNCTYHCILMMFSTDAMHFVFKILQKKIRKKLRIVFIPPPGGGLQPTKEYSRGEI